MKYKDYYISWQYFTIAMWTLTALYKNEVDFEMLQLKHEHRQIMTRTDSRFSLLPPTRREI